jgi:hypothetical protein
MGNMPIVLQKSQYLKDAKLYNYETFAVYF